MATVTSPDGEQFVAVSIYGLMDNTGHRRVRHATTPLHRILGSTIWRNTGASLLAARLGKATA